MQDDFGNADIEATGHLCLRAAEDLRNCVSIALWTRGLVPLDLPDPLGMDYLYDNSWGAERIDVTGCILGSDGSGANAIIIKDGGFRNPFSEESLKEREIEIVSCLLVVHFLRFETSLFLFFCCC